VRAAFAPVPVLCAPYFDEEVLGGPMLTRLGDELFAARGPEEVLHDRLAHELSVGDEGATLRLSLPFAEKGDIAVKMIGDELIVRVDEQKRTIMLPGPLARYRPSEAEFSDGELRIHFTEAGAVSAGSARG